MLEPVQGRQRLLSKRTRKILGGIYGFALGASLGWYLGGVGGVILIAPLPTLLLYAFPWLLSLALFAAALLALVVGFVWVIVQLWGVGR